ncbi:peptidoglycan DD-metalloendopeptidase family protein [Aestuariivirga litoralis]|uniref:peptidoglycan DD-metalloendopeptidase family protein n=1 Tax=Aestuariivirga litoralis TaxID=2650924 RepID=UPI0018C54C78|nr:M23 family metallopeptidase [Aestuariivirga litoralis]MBG1231666.1 peptidoglycan DD-metalloendopeptidase family protein [Aestuariivirga litoralis]
MGKSVSCSFEGAVRWQLLLASAAAVLLAGCSGSVERFSENYSNPSDSDPVYTASIPKQKLKYTAPSYKAPKYSEPQISDNSDAIVESPIASKPIVKAPVYDYTKSYSQQAATKPAYEQPKYSYNAPAAPAYQKPAYKQPQVIEDQQAAADEPVIVSKKKPVVAPFKMAPADQQIASAKPKAQVIADDADIVAPSKTGAGKAYTIAKGDTLFSLGRKYNMSPFAIADANKLPHDKPLAVGRQIIIPTSGTATAKLDSKIKPLAGDDATGKSDMDSDQEQTAQVQAPVQKAAPVQDAAPADGQLAMRWPVRGKVISPFGPKQNGMKNEGINISVPEGTNVQAAEGGVVAYAGNELKGYGNLVLIRHSGGYVTAYAHNSQIIVKKGETVKRGDIIAKSGATGAVQSPQLHFEVRKGATALNPTTFLNAATASN